MAKEKFNLKEFKKKYNLTDKDFNIIKTEKGYAFLLKNTEKELIKKWSKAFESEEIKTLYQDKLYLIQSKEETIYLKFLERDVGICFTKEKFKKLQDAIFNVVFVVTDYKGK